MVSDKRILPLKVLEGLPAGEGVCCVRSTKPLEMPFIALGGRLKVARNTDKSNFQTNIPLLCLFFQFHHCPAVILGKANVAESVTGSLLLKYLNIFDIKAAKENL